MTLIGKSCFEAHIHERHGTFGEQALGFLNSFVDNIFVRGTSGTFAEQIGKMLGAHLDQARKVFCEQPGAEVLVNMVDHKPQAIGRKTSR